MPRGSAIRAALVAAMIIAPTLSPAQVVTVFGLPLGGAAPKLPVCSRAAIGEPVAATCWADRQPGRATTSAEVRLPASATPVWAGEAPSLKLQLVGGLIAVIAIDAHISAATDATISLGQRFGRPTSHVARDGNLRDQWDRPDLALELLCARQLEICTVTFRSAAAVASELALNAAKSRRDAARPAAP